MHGYMEIVPEGCERRWAVFRTIDRFGESCKVCGGEGKIKMGKKFHPQTCAACNGFGVVGEKEPLTVEDALDVESDELTLTDLHEKYEGRDDVVFTQVWVEKKKKTLDFGIGKTLSIKGEKGQIRLTCIDETETHWLLSQDKKKIDMKLSKQQVKQMLENEGQCDGKCETCSLNAENVKKEKAHTRRGHRSEVEN